MRKFRHIKTGKELSVKKSSVNKKEALIFGDWEIPMWVIENSNEWEEVIERDYDILKFKDTFTGNVFEGNEEYGYSPNNERTYVLSLEDMLSKGRCVDSGDIIITKVKRLFGGEIFTIGDFVKETITGQCKGWEIKEFSLKDSRCFSCGVNINNIKKLKEVLLTTEDGVDIFVGDECYAVSDDFDLLFTSYTPKDYEKKGKVRAFSTKEAAEKYIVVNKPCLSYKEVEDMYREDRFGWLSRLEKLIMLRKVNCYEKY